jgi:cytidyltransferase-like protein
MSTISIVSGGFDPIHSGHINYLNSAKSLAQKLIVGINSNEWLVAKKGKYFLPFEERKIIIENLKSVDMVLNFEDDEVGSAKNLIKKIRVMFPESTLIFCNGGDRTSVNIPEMDLVDDKLQFSFGVGGANKQNSSSWILSRWKSN